MKYTKPSSTCFESGLKISSKSNSEEFLMVLHIDNWLEVVYFHDTRFNISLVMD
jgi:hypothetical protein